MAIANQTLENQSTMMLSCARDSDEYQEFYDMAQYITGLIVYPVLCIIGIIGNILALVVLAHRDMRTSTNVYLSSLAVSDTIKLINDLMYFILVAMSQTKPEMGSRAVSLVYPLAHYVFNMSVCVTAWLTVSVAVERFISVCYASRAKELCTIKRARWVCTAVFISMSILAIPSGLRYRMTTIFDPVLNISCVTVVPTELGNNEQFMVSYSWIQNSLRGLIPVFILVVLNIRIINELRKERVKGKKFSARNRITTMLVSIIFMFLVCITPDAIMSTFFGKGYVEEGNLVKGIREITDSLLAVNSAFNFILYCAMSAVFRTTFIKIFCPAWISGGMEKDAILLNRRTTSALREDNRDEQPFTKVVDTSVTNHTNNSVVVAPSNGFSKACDGVEHGDEEFL